MESHMDNLRTGNFLKAFIMANTSANSNDCCKSPGTVGVPRIFPTCDILIEPASKVIENPCEWIDASSSSSHDDLHPVTSTEYVLQNQLVRGTAIGCILSQLLNTATDPEEALRLAGFRLKENIQHILRKLLNRLKRCTVADVPRVVGQIKFTNTEIEFLKNHEEILREIVPKIKLNVLYAAHEAFVQRFSIGLIPSSGHAISADGIETQELKNWSLDESSRDSRTLEVTEAELRVFEALNKLQEEDFNNLANNFRNSLATYATDVGKINGEAKLKVLVNVTPALQHAGLHLIGPTAHLLVDMLFDRLLNRYRSFSQHHSTSEKRARESTSGYSVRVEKQDHRGDQRNVMMSEGRHISLYDKKISGEGRADPDYILVDEAETANEHEKQKSVGPSYKKVRGDYHRERGRKRYDELEKILDLANGLQDGNILTDRSSSETLDNENRFGGTDVSKTAKFKSVALSDVIKRGSKDIAIDAHIPNQGHGAESGNEYRNMAGKEPDVPKQPFAESEAQSRDGVAPTEKTGKAGTGKSLPESALALDSQKVGIPGMPEGEEERAGRSESEPAAKKLRRELIDQLSTFLQHTLGANLSPVDDETKTTRRQLQGTVIEAKPEEEVASPYVSESSYEKGLAKDGMEGNISAKTWNANAASPDNRKASLQPGNEVQDRTPTFIPQRQRLPVDGDFQGELPQHSGGLDFRPGSFASPLPVLSEMNTNEVLQVLTTGTYNGNSLKNQPYTMKAMALEAGLRALHDAVGQMRVDAIKSLAPDLKVDPEKIRKYTPDQLLDLITQAMREPSPKSSDKDESQRENVVSLKDKKEALKRRLSFIETLQRKIQSARNTYHDELFHTFQRVSTNPELLITSNPFKDTVNRMNQDLHDLTVEALTNAEPSRQRREQAIKDMTASLYQVTSAMSKSKTSALYSSIEEDTISESTRRSTQESIVKSTRRSSEESDQSKELQVERASEKIEREERVKHQPRDEPRRKRLESVLKTRPLRVRSGLAKTSAVVQSRRVSGRKLTTDEMRKASSITPSQLSSMRNKHAIQQQPSRNEDRKATLALYKNVILDEQGKVLGIYDNENQAVTSDEGSKIGQVSKTGRVVINNFYKGFLGADVMEIADGLYKAVPQILGDEKDWSKGASVRNMEPPLKDEFHFKTRRSFREDFTISRPFLQGPLPGFQSSSGQLQPLEDLSAILDQRSVPSNAQQTTFDSVFSLGHPPSLSSIDLNNAIPASNPRHELQTILDQHLMLAGDYGPSSSRLQTAFKVVDTEGNFLAKIRLDGTVIGANGEAIGYLSPSGVIVSARDDSTPVLTNANIVDNHWLIIGTVTHNGVLKAATDAERYLIGTLFNDGRIVAVNGKLVGHISKEGNALSPHGHLMGRLTPQWQLVNEKDVPFAYVTSTGKIFRYSTVRPPTQGVSQGRNQLAVKSTALQRTEDSHRHSGKRTENLSANKKGANQPRKVRISSGYQLPTLEEILNSARTSKLSLNKEEEPSQSQKQEEKAAKQSWRPENILKLLFDNSNRMTSTDSTWWVQAEENVLTPPPPVENVTPDEPKVLPIPSYWTVTERRDLVKGAASFLVDDLFKLALTHLLFQAEAGDDTDRIMERLKLLETKDENDPKAQAMWQPQLRESYFRRLRRKRGLPSADSKSLKQELKFWLESHRSAASASHVPTPTRAEVMKRMKSRYQRRKRLSVKNDGEANVLFRAKSTRSRRKHKEK